MFNILGLCIKSAITKALKFISGRYERPGFTKLGGLRVDKLLWKWGQKTSLRFYQIFTLLTKKKNEFPAKFELLQPKVIFSENF